MGAMDPTVSYSTCCRRGWDFLSGVMLTTRPAAVITCCSSLREHLLGSRREQGLGVLCRGVGGVAGEGRGKKGGAHFPQAHCK